MIRVLAFAALLSAFCINARSQESHGNHGEGHDTWHGEFYSKLLTPKTKVSCCNLADCRPTQGRQVDGKWEVEINGKFVEVLDEKIAPVSAPDWGFHVCAPRNFSGKPEHVYCVVVPPEG